MSIISFLITWNKDFSVSTWKRPASSSISVEMQAFTRSACPFFLSSSKTKSKLHRFCFWLPSLIRSLSFHCSAPHWPFSTASFAASIGRATSATTSSIQDTVSFYKPDRHRGHQTKYRLYCIHTAGRNICH